MENRGDVKSGCKGVLLRNSGRNSGVRALGTDSGRTGSVRTLELNSGRTGRKGCSEGAADACVFFANEPRKGRTIGEGGGRAGPPSRGDASQEGEQ